jgi:hypothetical protein
VILPRITSPQPFRRLPPAVFPQRRDDPRGQLEDSPGPPRLGIAVGFALGTYHVSLLLAAAVIGAVSVAMSLVGLELGARIGLGAGQRGELFGGLVLIGDGAAIGAGIT